MINGLRYPFRLEHLPWLGKLHRNAFRSGRSDTPEAIKFLSRIGFYLGKSASWRPVPGRVGVQVNGQWRSFTFDARNRMFSSVYFEKYTQQGFEPAVMAIVDALVPDDGVFYDIGSNWGYYSIYLASRRGFRGQVHSFEPWPSTFDDLRNTVRQLNLQDVVFPHHCAVGAENGHATMQCGSHSGMAKLTGNGNGVTVPIRSLDDLDIEPPHLMKIDTEGHEEQVFSGARRLLTQHRPMFVFEHRYDLLLTEQTKVTGLKLLESLDYCLLLPSWHASEGLRLVSCESETRCEFPEYPDLLACPREKLPQLQSAGYAAPARAA